MKILLMIIIFGIGFMAGHVFARRKTYILRKQYLCGEPILWLVSCGDPEILGVSEETYVRSVPGEIFVR